MLLANRLFRVSICTAAMAGAIGIIHFSRPDRGGIGRCESIFGFEKLRERGVELQPFGKWKPFEKPKFRIAVDREKVTHFLEYLEECGYSSWTEGGLQYGSLSIGWDATSAVFYSLKRSSGHVHVVAHDKTNDLFYVIFSQ